jgi:hypothetical protein
MTFDMRPRLNRFRRTIAALVLAIAALAGLAAAADGLVGTTVHTSRHTPGVAAVGAPGQTAMLTLHVTVSHHTSRSAEPRAIECRSFALAARSACADG